MKVTSKIMVQPVPQTVGILFLPCGRDFEILEDLLCEFIDGQGRRFLAAKLLHFIVNALEDIGLRSYNLWSHYTAAPADDGKAFVIGLL
jgi:hypothetical protein